MGRALRRRLPALLALALPVVAGLAFLHLGGAPQHYLWVNSGALIIALLAATVVAKGSVLVRRVLVVALLAGLFAPLVTGPWLDGVARWIPVGPFRLHAAGLLLPSLLVLALEDREYAPPILLAAVIAGLLQPDAALGFTIVFATVGFHDVTKDWRIGVVTIIAFFAALVMAVRGNPRPQDFVENVLVDAAAISPVLAAVLFLSLVASFFIILHAIPAPKAMRYTLAGCLFGFTILSIMANYPSILVGYGAAPILGFGFGLGLACTGAAENSASRDD